MININDVIIYGNKTSNISLIANLSYIDIKVEDLAGNQVFDTEDLKTAFFFRDSLLILFVFVAFRRKNIFFFNKS